MKALNAFRRASLETGDLIPGALVPDLTKLNPNTRALSEGTNILFKWLRQQGLSDKQIMSKTPAEWSAIKISQIDKGLNISRLVSSVRDTVVDAIPKTRAQWMSTAADYFLPGAVRKAGNTAKQAWIAFKKENWIQETGMGLDELQTKDIDITVFDKFMKAYTQQAQADDRLATMKSFVNRAKSGGKGFDVDLDMAVGRMRSAPGVYLQALRDASKNETPDVGWVQKNVRKYLLGEVEMLPMGDAKTAVLGKMLKSSPGNASVQQAVTDYLEQYDAQPPREFAPPRDRRVVKPPAPGEDWPGPLPPPPEERISGIEGLLDPTSGAAPTFENIMDPDWRPAPPPAPWHAPPPAEPPAEPTVTEPITLESMMDPDWRPAPPPTDPTVTEPITAENMMDPDWRPAPPPRPLESIMDPTREVPPPRPVVDPVPRTPLDPAIVSAHQRFQAEFFEEPSTMSRWGSRIRGWFQKPKQHESLVSWYSGAKQIGIRREDMPVYNSPDVILARDAAVEEDWATRIEGVRQDPFVNQAPWQEESAPSTLEMMQAYNQDPEPTMVEELREASLDPYDYFDNDNRFEALVEEWRSDLEPQPFVYKPKTDVEKVEEFMLSEFGPDADEQEIAETAAFVREEIGETRGEEVMREFRERKAATRAETVATRPEQGPTTEIQLDHDINTPVEKPYYDRVVGDMLLAETQSRRTPNQELLGNVDTYLEGLQDSEVKGMSITQRMAWETKQAGISELRNKQLLSEADSLLDTLDDVQQVNWESDSVYHEFVQKWEQEETPGGIRAAPEEYTTPGGKPWNVGEMKTTKVNVEGISVFEEAGISEIELVGVDPESINTAQIASAWEDLTLSGKAGFMFKQIFTKAGAKYMAEFTASTLVMMGLQAALHNDDTWMIVNAAAYPVIGATGVAVGVISSAVDKYATDYIRRQIAWQYSDDSVLNKVCYIRSGGKWVPAIVKSKGEPTEAATFLDAKGLDENWEGAVTLTVETGYGLTMDDSGNLKWLKSGRKDRVIMRQSDIDWHGDNSLRDVENWKPWTNVYFPDNEDSQRDMIKTGLTEGVDARPLGEIFAELNSSNRFRAMVELSHMLHNQHIVDPGYKSKWVQSSGGIGWDAERQVNVYNNPSHWGDDHPEMFEKFERHDWMPSGRQSSFWRNINAGDNIGFYAEIHNPDNMQQFNLQQKRETDVDELVGFLSADIEKLHGNLSEETKDELRWSTVQAVPYNAVLFDEYIKTLGEGPLSPEAKQFRITQAQLQFTIMQASKYFADSKGADRGTDMSIGQAAYLTDRISTPMYDQYKKSLDHLKEIHPDLAIAELKSGEHGFLMFGGEQHSYGPAETWHNTNAWGIRDVISTIREYGPIQKHPAIRRAVPDHMSVRAFMTPSHDKAPIIIPMDAPYMHKIVTPESQTKENTAT